MADFLDQPTRGGAPPAADARADAAAQIARLAGKIALDYFERAEVSWKPDDSMVTEADVAIQAWLEDALAGVAQLADRRLQPARIGAGKGHAPIGINRREFKSDD